MSREATKATTRPVSAPTSTSWSTNCHQPKSSSPAAAAVNARTAGSARPSLSPDSRLSECRTRRGTRGFVTTAELSTGSVGDSRAPTRNYSFQPRSVTMCVISAIRTQVSGIARTSLRSGRCQASCSISSSTSRPSRNRITISATTARPCTNCEVGSSSSTSSPPSPSTNPATTKAAVSDRKLLRARPEISAPATISTPNTASGASRNSTPAATGGTRELCQTGSPHLATVMPVIRRPCVLVASGVALATAALPAAAMAAPPREQTLSSGWEVRVAAAAPAEPQPAPPEETAPEGAGPAIRATPAGVAAQAPGEWQPAQVPSVFDTRALPSLYPGQVRRYRVSFRGPPTPRGFSWLLHFESVRRSATVFLNGRRLGRNVDPYTPFAFEARGLRPGQPNELVVLVDGRKNPDLPEGWWNWNGIVRPVSLVPAGPAHLEDLGTMSRVRCGGPARRCRAELLLDGLLQRRGLRAIEPSLDVKLRAPGG